MNFIAFLFLALVGLQPVVSGEDELIEKISGWLKTSNSKEISKNFSSTVQLIILNDEDLYTKPHAEIVLKDFFSKYKPTSAKIIHKLNSNPNYKFAVVHLETDKGTFRVSYSLKNAAGKFSITEMTFENLAD